MEKVWLKLWCNHIQYFEKYSTDDFETSAHYNWIIVSTYLPCNVVEYYIQQHYKLDYLSLC